VPNAIRALIETQGPIGGPLDTWIDFGGSGLPLRAQRVEVGLAIDAGSPLFRGHGARRAAPAQDRRVGRGFAAGGRGAAGAARRCPWPRAAAYRWCAAIR
jgi:hypothetical protein